MPAFINVAQGCGGFPGALIYQINWMEIHLVEVEMPSKYLANLSVLVLICIPNFQHLTKYLHFEFFRFPIIN